LGQERSEKTTAGEQISQESSEINAIRAEKSSKEILLMLKGDASLSAREIEDRLEISRRTVEKKIAKLRKDGRIRRIGPDKGGHWEVVE